MIQGNCKILVLSLIFVAIQISGLQGFEVRTHTILSEKATDSSRLNEFLTTTLRFEFSRGTGEEIGQGEFKTVRQLIADVGAVNEDKPEIRSRTHFHDPTKAWAQAGLILPPFGTFQSSVLWSQNPDQGSGGKHSWKDARDSYFNALTATNNTDRKIFYSETFESLGHLIHLVQDAATPAHSRNDIHLGLITGNTFGFTFLNKDRFHKWAQVKGVGAINSAASQPFNSSILNQNYNGLVPIAGIIDTTTDGQGLPSDATNIGIAEYSNANFFSDDTILKDYTYPSISQMALSQEPGPDGPEPRSYLRKNFGPGPTGYRAAVFTRLIDFIPPSFSPRQLELDDNVMADYAELLFPRAIGYSAGLIDYFFRGRINTFPAAVEDYLWTQWDQRPNSIRVDGVSVDVDDGSEQGGQGTMHLVLFLRGTDVDPASESIPPVVVSHPVSVSASSTPQTVIFPFDALPFPQTFPEIGTFSAEYWASIVYRGPLGQESDAVAVGGHCVDPTDGSKYNWRYDFEHLHGYNPFEGGGGPDVHIAYIAWC